MGWGWSQQLWDGASEELGALPFEATATGGPTSWTITPTGGVVVGGATPILHGRIFPASGGAVFGGSASFIRGRVQVSSGGVTLSGDAPLVRGKIIAPSGGVLVLGSAVVLFSGVSSTPQYSPLRTMSRRTMRTSHWAGM